MAAVHPARSGFLLLLGLLLAVSAKREQTGDWEGDAAFGADCFGEEGGQTAAAGALESTADAGGIAAVVEVFPAQAEEFALAQSGAEGEFEQCAEAVALGGGEQGAGFVGGEGFEAAVAGCAGADVAGDVARISSSRTASSRADLRTE